MSVLLTDRKLSPELAQWAALRTPHVGELGYGPNWSVGVALQGELVAVIVWHDFQPQHGTIQLSMASASPRWINRRIVARLLALAFEQTWGLQRVQIRKVWVAIPSTAERTVKLNEALGLRREATLRHQYAPGVHAIICSIMLGEYRKLYQSEPSPGVWARTAA
jgi:hypothetical protein